MDAAKISAIISQWVTKTYLILKYETIYFPSSIGS